MRMFIESMYSHSWIAITRTHSANNFHTGSEQLPVVIVLYCTIWYYFYQQVASIACQTPHTYLPYGVISGRYYSSLERYSNIIWFHTIVCYLPFHSHPTSITSHIHRQINRAGSEKNTKARFPQLHCILSFLLFSRNFLLSSTVSQPQDWERAFLGCTANARKYIGIVQLGGAMFASPWCCVSTYRFSQRWCNNSTTSVVVGICWDSASEGGVTC